MAPMYVDSHCHLSDPRFEGRIDELRAAMAVAQVRAALVISTTLADFERVHALAMRHPEFWASAGVHPDSDDDDQHRVAADDAETSVEQLIALARRPRVVAIGETGLDYYRLGERSVDDMAWQRERFRTHIRAARALDLPLVIHTRSASDDTLALLRDEAAHGEGAAPRGVFHCFTESDAVARAALELGFHISFSGILSFRNAADLREVARMVPLDRLLIETDSPYLAPVPYRGKTNQPAYVVEVARQLAQLKGCTPEQIGEQTTHNFNRLFLAKEQVKAAS